MKKTNMLKLSAIALILLSSVFLLTGCGTDENKEANSGAKNELEGLEVVNYEQTEGYVDCKLQNGLTFSYPEKWKSLGTESQPQYADYDQASELYGTNVSLLSEKIPSSMSMQKYIDKNIEVLKDGADIDGEIKQDSMNLNGKKVYRFQYVMKDKDFSLKTIQLLVEIDGKAYILTMGCDATKEEKAQPIFDNMVKSFRVQ